MASPPFEQFMSPAKRMSSALEYVFLLLTHFTP
jgi:hypothetical protein